MSVLFRSIAFRFARNTAALSNIYIFFLEKNLAYRGVLYGRIKHIREFDRHLCPETIVLRGSMRSLPRQGASLLVPLKSNDDSKYETKLFRSLSATDLLRSAREIDTPVNSVGKVSEAEKHRTRLFIPKDTEYSS